MKPWNEEISTTWLKEPAFVRSLDGWVREQLVEHRPDAKTESVAAWTVEMLSAEVHRLGAEGRWLWCTSAVSLLAELVFCAADGGVFPSASARYRDDFAKDVGALRVVRNAVFHPAFQNRDAGSGKPHVEELFVLLDNDDDADVRDAALRMAVDWSYLAARPVTSFALRKLNSAGRIYANELGLTG